MSHKILWRVILIKNTNIYSLCHKFDRKDFCKRNVKGKKQMVLR